MAYYNPKTMQIELSEDDKKELQTPIKISKNIIDKILFGDNYQFFADKEITNLATK